MVGKARAEKTFPSGGPKAVVAPKSDHKRILIMMSLTGGGHKASAEALKSAFKELYGNKYEIDIVDMWTDHTPYPYNQFPKVSHGAGRMSSRVDFNLCSTLFE